MRQLDLFNTLQFRIDFGDRLSIIREDEAEYDASHQRMQALRQAPFRDFLTKV